MATRSEVIALIQQTLKPYAIKDGPGIDESDLLRSLRFPVEQITNSVSSASITTEAVPGSPNTMGHILELRKKSGIPAQANRVRLTDVLPSNLITRPLLDQRLASLNQLPPIGRRSQVVKRVGASGYAYANIDDSSDNFKYSTNLITPVNMTNNSDANSTFTISTVYNNAIYRALFRIQGHDKDEFVEMLFVLGESVRDRFLNEYNNRVIDITLTSTSVSSGEVSYSVSTENVGQASNSRGIAANTYIELVSVQAILGITNKGPDGDKGIDGIQGTFKD